MLRIIWITLAFMGGFVLFASTMTPTPLDTNGLFVLLGAALIGGLIGLVFSLNE